VVTAGAPRRSATPVGYAAAGRVLLILASGVGLVASIAQLFNGVFAYLFIPMMVSLLILALSRPYSRGRSRAHV
jgi:hypothetical protein